MSSTREKIIAEWSKGDTGENAKGWVTSEEPVTLHEPHQRIDENKGLIHYKRGERGCWCSDCGAKVTLGPNLEKEYGHFGGCEHRNVDREPNNKKGEL